MRTLFFSCEPGGAEVLIPVVHLLQQENIHVDVLSYGHGRVRFSAKGVNSHEIDPILKDGTQLLYKFRPDVLITSAASLPDQDQSERLLWLAASKLQIPSIAFLDQWQNYSARFSGSAKDSHLQYLPDLISCIDENGRREMLEEGFPADRLRALGHPYLSSLDSLAASVSSVELRARLGFDQKEPVSLFVSEAIKENFGRIRGYDQFDALEMFFSIVGNDNSKGRPIVKLHPKDDKAAYTYLQQRYKALQPLFLTDELTPIECLALSSQVYGMTSIMLIEAFIIGLPVTSLQPGLVGKDQLILSRLGVIPIARSQNVTPVSGNKAFSWKFEAQHFLALLNEIVGD